MKLLVFVGLTISLPLLSIFDYDRAVTAGQQGDWKSACAQLTTVLVDQPDNAQLLYDSGVASYRSGDLDQADAYFKHVAESSAPKKLREQAYFNRGNVLVKKKELHKALKEYQQVLKLNPDNEQARHNYELVKQMLEQQEQQQEQENKTGSDQQNQQSSGESQDGSGQQEQESGQSSEDQQEESTESTNSSDSSGQSNGQESSSTEEQEQAEQDKQDERDKDSFDEDEEEKEGQHEGSPKEEDAAEYDAQWGKDNQPDSNPDDAQERNELNGATDSEHDSSLQQDTSSSTGTTAEQDKKNQENEQGYAYQPDEQMYNDLDDWVVQLLKEREQKDSRLNKKMIRSTVTKALDGSDEKNCW